MIPPPLWQMLLLVAGTYLATYGPGRLLVLVLGLQVNSFQERLGVSCAVGAVVLGWIGYVAVMAGLPWLAVAGGWLAMALGLFMVVRGFTWAKETCDLENRHRTILALAVAIGLGFAAGMSYWQITYGADGSMSGRQVWPDLLYRNAVMGQLLPCDGPPDWPWLAGIPMKGMSLLRFTALVPIFRALGIASTSYQIAALWLGLFGVPVAACALLAFFRALGAGRTVGAWAVVLTSFLGNPRWLFNDRFAHSPALHWAGTDVFAVAIPVLFAMLALIVLAIREQQKAALALSALMLVSGMGHVPWEGLAIYVAVPLFLVAAVRSRSGERSDRRRVVGTAAVLALAALGGIVVLKTLMGSGTGGGSLLSAIGPSPTIRGLSWAFPFLAEPLRPLFGMGVATGVLKLVKFVAVYAVAVFFYLWGSMWVRNVILPNTYRFEWRRLREPEYAFGLCLVIGGVLLSSVVNFNKLAYEGAQYDVFRVLFPALLLANLACALLLVEYWPRLRRGWGLILLLVLIFYGSWENTQLVYWSRVGLQPTTIGSVSDLRYLVEHAAPRDVVFMNPRVEPPVSSTMTVYISHRWGFMSGLVPVRFWLDNEDMARKFGQGPIWDQRWAEAERALKGSPQGFSAFLRRNGINWVILGYEEKRLVRAPGLQPALVEDGLGLYRVVP